MKFVVDMNSSPRWVAVLTNAGWQVKHWSEIGRASASDRETREYAAANDYAVLTHDLGFGTIFNNNSRKQT